MSVAGNVDYKEIITQLRSVDSRSKGRLLENAAVAIETLIAADVAPVAHGEWVGGYHTHKGQWIYTKPCCSLCSFEQDGVSNFCPNCGADMRGDKHEKL